MTLATVRMPAVAEMLTIVGEVAERYASSRRDTTRNNRGASNNTVTKNSKEACNWLLQEQSRRGLEYYGEEFIFTFELRKFEHKIEKT
jgi:hypothetical protein